MSAEDFRDVCQAGRRLARARNVAEVLAARRALRDAVLRIETQAWNEAYGEGATPRRKTV